MSHETSSSSILFGGSNSYIYLMRYKWPVLWCGCGGRQAGVTLVNKIFVYMPVYVGTYQQIWKLSRCDKSKFGSCRGVINPNLEVVEV